MSKEEFERLRKDAARKKRRSTSRGSSRCVLYLSHTSGFDRSPCQGLTNTKLYTSAGVKLPSLCLEEGIFIALIVA